MKTCLIVDDNNIHRVVAGKVFEGLGFSIKEAANADEAYEQVKAGGVDVVMLDWYMPGSDGLTVLADILKLNPTLPILMCSGMEGQKSAQRVIDAGAKAFISKPINRAIVEKACKAAGLVD